jgi:hypothetical protein
MGNCKNKNCGCQDTGLLTPPPCDPIGCPGPEACSETFSADCVIYTGPTLPDYKINYGDTVADYLQKLLGASLNTFCYEYIQLFKVNTISTTSVSFSWEGTDPANFRLDYSTDNLNWTLGSTIIGNTGTVSGLTTNTTYYFRLAALTNVCYSLTLEIKTA